VEFSAGRAARGSVVTVGAQWSKVAIQIAGLAVLSRLLTPSDFGIVAIVTVIAGLAQLFRDFGLSLAAIQSPSLSVGQRNNLFWLNTCSAGVIGLVLFMSSPAISRFFGDDRIEGIAKALCLVFILSGMSTQYRVSLVRDQRYFAIALGDVVSQFVGLSSAMIAALSGAGYWSLVYQQIAIAVSLLFCYLSSARWIPGWYSCKISSRKFLIFGGRLVVVQLISYVMLNIDKLIIGKLYGTYALGLYSRAYQIFGLPLSQSVAPITNLAVHSLSSVLSDRVRYRKRALQMETFATYMALIPLGVLFGLAFPVVSTLLGSDWLDASDLLRVLCIGGAFQILGMIYYWIFVSSGRPEVHLRCTTVSVPAGLLAIVAGSFHGVIGIASGVSVALFIEWLIPAVWGVRKVGLAAQQFIFAGLRPLLLAFVIGAVSWAVSAAIDHRAIWVQILIGAVDGICFPVALALLCGHYRRDMHTIVATAKLVLKR
jgi:O-antigen/teichoic acid export membrane protein